MSSIGNWLYSFWSADTKAEENPEETIIESMEVMEAIEVIEITNTDSTNNDLDKQIQADINAEPELEPELQVNIKAEPESEVENNINVETEPESEPEVKPVELEVEDNCLCEVIKVHSQEEVERLINGGVTELIRSYPELAFKLQDLGINLEDVRLITDKEENFVSRYDPNNIIDVERLIDEVFCYCCGQQKVFVQKLCDSRYSICEDCIYEHNLELMLKYNPKLPVVPFHYSEEECTRKLGYSIQHCYYCEDCWDIVCLGCADSCKALDHNLTFKFGAHACQPTLGLDASKEI